MPDHKPKEIFIEDVSELNHLMYLYLIEEGVIDLEYAAKIKNSKHRLDFIREYIDARVYTNAIWRLDVDLSYEQYVENACKEYIRLELPGMKEISEGMRRVFNLIAKDIDKIIPDVLHDRTWKVWTCKLIATSLILRDEGDYRINTFIQAAKYDETHEFYGKVTVGELCHYD